MAELRNCVKVEVAVVGSQPSLIVRTVSVCVINTEHETCSVDGRDRFYTVTGGVTD